LRSSKGALGGIPKIEETQNIPDFPYVQLAEMLELKGIRISDADQVGDAWEAALAADRPFIIDAVVDPTILAVPPHVTSARRRTISQRS
jgi:pyruvate dehydrogenase (quinone)